MKNIFNVWDKLNKQWALGGFYLDEHGDLFEIWEDVSEEGSGFRKEPATDRYQLSWVLNEKDSHGATLYQGCICEVDIDHHEQSILLLVLSDVQIYHGLNHDDSYYRITTLSKVGDIYENPELLERASDYATIF